MAANTSSSVSAGKASVPSISANYSQVTSTAGSDVSQKRSNSSGSFGAGAQTRGQSQARSQQTPKKQNKAQRRAKLVDDGSLVEVDAMKSINSRKGQTSITHLMNFSLPPRPHQQNHHYHSNARYPRRNPTWGLGAGYRAVDKARYVHANYRFILRPDQEYSTQAVDADVHISWDSVLQILASADTQSTNCPICLSTPVAPRMAKCGHIFCLPCLIRYMHSTDDVNPVPERRARWKKCPICEDSVYVSEVRPVRWFSGQEASMLREGGDVLLRLLMREPGTSLAIPRDAAESYGRQEDIPWFHIAEMMDYARFMKGGEAYMEEQYDQEIEALSEQEREDELMFGDDTTWTRKAVAAIEESKRKLEGLGNPPALHSQSSDKRNSTFHSFRGEGPQEQQPKDGPSAITNGIQKLSVEASAHQHPSRKAPFFFYHALPNFFLSPLDIRILKAAFGDFSSFPSTILPRVEHISTGHIVDEDLRKRAKYMAHLPHGCEVTFLECDWTEIINPTTLEQFKEDINRRRRRNLEKESREERDRLRAEKEEDDKRWASARRRRPSVPEKSFSETDFVPLASLPHSPLDESSLANTPPWATQRAQSSFATLASPGTSPEGRKTVWGTTAITPSTPPLPVAQNHQPVDDGWLQGWERDLLDEAEAVALIEASTNGESSSKQVSNTPVKKGKKKKITLMSTNVRRGA